MSALIEEWRPLPGFDGWIDVSNLGGARRWYAPRSWELLAAPVYVAITASGAGYLSFSARAPWRRVQRMPLHVAVLLAFAGMPAPFDVACHFPDPEPSNCRFENLRWDTRGANHVDGKIHRSGLLDRVADRLAFLRLQFPHLREDVSGIVLQPRENPWKNNGAHTAERAAARRALLAQAGGVACQ